jgi:chorismate synthase
MKSLRWTTAGESHGPCLVAILEGMPAGLPLDVPAIDAHLARRQQGYGRSKRMRIEHDVAELLSGTRAGLTLGSPIAIRIANRDHSIESLPVPTNPRPGHADLAGCQKLGIHDPRAVMERASARETAARVALASVARQLLEHFGIEVFAHTTELGGSAVSAAAIHAAFELPAAERQALRARSAFFTLDPDHDEPLIARVDAAREAGDSLGGVFEVRAFGLPPGLGSYQSGPERLTSRLGAALFSIPAIKGVELGLGFAAARLPGSEVHDAIVPRANAEASAEASAGPNGRFARASHRSGGLEGGLTTGGPLCVRAAMKPIPTLRRGLPTVDFETGAPVQATYQRSDVTSVPACGVVGEAMVALVLAEAFLDKFAGDSLSEVAAAFEAYGLRLAAL